MRKNAKIEIKRNRSGLIPLIERPGRKETLLKILIFQKLPPELKTHRKRVYTYLEELGLQKNERNKMNKE